MRELKRCPFCGGEARFLQMRTTLNIKLGYIKCTECGLRLEQENCTEDFAIARWNTRKPVENVLERLEVRKAQLEKAYKSGYGTPLELAQCNGAIAATENDIRIVKEEVG